MFRLQKCITRFVANERSITNNPDYLSGVGIHACRRLEFDLIVSMRSAFETIVSLTYILSGTSIPNKENADFIVFAVKSEIAKRNARLFSFSSLSIGKA